MIAGRAEKDVARESGMSRVEIDDWAGAAFIRESHQLKKAVE